MPSLVRCAVCRLRIERAEEDDDEERPPAPEHAALIFFDEITRGDSSLCEPPQQRLPFPCRSPATSQLPQLALAWKRASQASYPAPLALPRPPPPTL